MPFHLAVFDADAAGEVIARFPEYRHWYIAGHSMGGAMASRFASEHPDLVDGLILMGAYIYEDYPAENTLTIYGSLNQSVKDHIDCTENIVEIEGGNHAQFGSCGPQKKENAFPRHQLSREDILLFVFYFGVYCFSSKFFY